MTTNPIIAASQLRRSRIHEFRELCSAAAIVLAGLVLAALYCLLTHQIPI
jgi:hypothetical protein